MEISRNQLILLALVGIFITTTGYYIRKSNTTVNSLVSSIKDNKNSINLIKKNIDRLLAASKTTNLDNTSISNEAINTTNEGLNATKNDIQSLLQRYEILADELKAIKKKSLQAPSQNQTSPREAVNTVENFIAQQKANEEEAKRKYDEEMRQQEEAWQIESVDNIATTAINSELENIFSPEVEGISGVSSECKSSGCKITLELTNDFHGSPVPMLLDKGGSAFQDKNFTVNNSIDPSTGQIRMTIYVTKDINNEDG